MIRIIYIALVAMLSGCSATIPTSYIEPFVLDQQLSGTAVAGAGWEFNDGVIQPLPTDDITYLKSNQVFENFVLTLEFFPVGNVNSGIFIRCQPELEINATNCYEINIWDDHPNQDSRTGSIVQRELPLEKISTIGQWNTCVIIADASSITVSMNGIVTTVHDSNELSNGFIALQRANAETIRFRNVRLESLD